MVTNKFCAQNLDLYEVEMRRLKTDRVVYSVTERGEIIYYQWISWSETK